jgi:hypothetical protein
MGLFSCLAVLGQQERRRKREPTHQLMEQSNPGSDVSDKDMAEEKSGLYHEGRVSYESPPPPTCSILKSPSPSVGHPIAQRPSTSPDLCVQANSTIQHERRRPASKTSASYRADRRGLSSAKSTSSKVSFSGSEGTGHRRGFSAQMEGKKLGAPTQYQSSDGVQEFSSRLYTSDNTKNSGKKSSKRW